MRGSYNFGTYRYSTGLQVRRFIERGRTIAQSTGAGSQGSQQLLCSWNFQNSKSWMGVYENYGDP